MTSDTLTPTQIMELLSLLLDKKSKIYNFYGVDYDDSDLCMIKELLNPIEDKLVKMLKRAMKKNGVKND